MNLCGSLSKGCELCFRGQKLPLSITFLCDKSCNYCPILPELSGKDIMLVAGKRVTSLDEIIDIAESYSGLSISGGEPLLKIGKLLELIKLSKERFGKEFHVHIYTNGNLLTAETMQRLANVGLDEIRIHNTDIEVFRIAVSRNIDVGLEMPCEPDKVSKTINLIHELDNLGVKFVNLNEMQSSRQSENRLRACGYDLDGQKVVGSEEAALKIIQQVKKDRLQISVHYCSIKQEINNAKERLKLVGI